MKHKAQYDGDLFKGLIIRKREDVLKNYYDQSPGVRDENVKRTDKVTLEPQVGGATAAEAAEWEEDEHGNFNQK